MTQNSMRLSWSRDELNRHLCEIMLDIHDRCVEYGSERDNYVNYLKGANIAGFIKVADAMLAYGVM
jgi:glutamate dehydrogenase (NADP+)